MREIAKRWLPPDDIYPGFYLSRIGHVPDFERKQVERMLKKLNLEINDLTIKNTFQIIRSLIIFIQTDGTDELTEFEQVYEPKIGTTYPLLVLIARTVTQMLLIYIVKKGVTKIKQSLEIWLKGESDLSSIECPEELSKEECQLLRKILQKSQINEEFAEHIRSIFNNWSE